MSAEREWRNTRWWRAVGSDGSLWCESSDEDEVREAARPGDSIQRLMEEVPRWGWVADGAALPAIDKSNSSFYDQVRALTDKAFRSNLLGVDFINAEDLETLLNLYNPNPPEKDEDSYDQLDSPPREALGEIPEFELPDDSSEAERARYRSRRSVALGHRGAQQVSTD